MVALFQGVGFFTVKKKGKYFQCKLGIELSIKDVQLIYIIKYLLLLGIVSFRVKKGISMVSLSVIKNIIW